MGGNSDRETETKNILRSLRSNKFFLKKIGYVVCGQKESATAVIGRTPWRGDRILENSQNDVKSVEC